MSLDFLNPKEFQLFMQNKIKPGKLRAILK
jgi:hypothetical protein